ncbi:hypothetical protein NC653_034331 [Populus alba x Populus x berolinensis]|uniref:Uncharacterized protein n=1 Tax=Populus alba x Populus x berolinensis TaxID=444605 RepID=A0AAD6LMP1_9ROSI|nr:hypothetical protein NC653_034331 [Populus alba x Populus x berolinensis]
MIQSQKADFPLAYPNRQMIWMGGRGATQRIGTDYTHSHEDLKDVMKKYEEGSAESGRWAIETKESQEFYYFECPLNGSSHLIASGSGEELLVSVVNERLVAALVEGLDADVVAIHIARAAISVAGAKAAKVVEERVATLAAAGKDKRC